VLPFPNRKYNIIYADPPWSMANSWVVESKEPPYPLMKQKDIEALPVSEITDKNCALLLWATNPLLPEALRVVESWGFRYVTVGFTWIKDSRILPTTITKNIGLGLYTRASSELCLLGVKGSMKVQDHSINQVQYFGIRDHSRKPHMIREKIVKLFGDLPRIELFARQRITGWDAWGNEVPNESEHPTLLSYEVL
jgi:N6-adenosine-specific RNA methylase IME4